MSGTKDSGPDASHRAVVAVRTNEAPLPGQWKLFLDSSYAWEGKLQPTELYNLANDPKESTNLLNQDDVKPVLEYLLKVAEEAAGDDGSSRE